MSPSPSGSSVKLFQSSRSLRTATRGVPMAPAADDLFQSSRSLRTATAGLLCDPPPAKISILAVLADRDGGLPGCLGRPHGISILAVLADRDSALRPGDSTPPHFNPRGPCGPRLVAPNSPLKSLLISILAVLADRDILHSNLLDTRIISILAVLADRDPRQGADDNKPSAFQSSRSLRTATPISGTHLGMLIISILAVLADRDGSLPVSGLQEDDFNPRGPCGPRQR